MRAAARGVYEKGGEIIGIAPTFFQSVNGVLYDNYSEFIYTETIEKQFMKPNCRELYIFLNASGYAAKIQNVPK